MVGRKCHAIVPSSPPLPTLEIDDKRCPLVEIKTDGDLILDVSFRTGQDCSKSIPRDALRLLRADKSAFPSPRILYRVKSSILAKNSEYFRLLLGPQFSEGIALAKRTEQLAEARVQPAQVEASKIPRISIVDEDFTTKTVGRENIFADLLRIVHGLEPATKPFTTQCWTVLALMADNYDLVPSISSRCQKLVVRHKYVVTPDRAGEEILRQKILILYHLEKGPHFSAATREKIKAATYSEATGARSHLKAQGAWWDIPYGIESEISYRRICVLRTIASIQTQFLQLYSSRDIQCRLGYDSSPSCDSFQLGEMVKFLSRKNLIFLVSFLPELHEDSNLKWLEAYTGEIDFLIEELRQCPSYQLDRNHTHCGLRTRLLPALDYIKTCMDTGLGISLTHTRAAHSRSRFMSWQSPSPTTQPTRPTWIDTNNQNMSLPGEDSRCFRFALVKSQLALGVKNSDPVELFTAQSWDWNTDCKISNERLGKAFGVMR
ncbi:hypothetical protein BGHDH14_bgh04275 [Blumeria hordei DH14]|uniref:BTB domain-containing protein n=1 Tax=Blumeria graminis f. sp. hordei (strain DH14) TaxID=546991 RepID=N1JMC0_BLUG1|nr:hypothetical protein BGHDH14_bgh04275 [Blumeria hordei DH14]